MCAAKSIGGNSMPVYVDNARNPYGRMLMSHMVADSLAELMAMADTIGVARKWFQPKSHRHFDVCQQKRAAAIAAGAIAIDRRQLVAVMRAYRTKLANDEAERFALATASSPARKPKKRGRT